MCVYVYSVCGMHGIYDIYVYVGMWCVWMCVLFGVCGMREYGLWVFVGVWCVYGVFISGAVWYMLHMCGGGRYEGGMLCACCVCKIVL